MVQDDLLQKIDERLGRMESEQKSQREDIKSIYSAQKRLEGTIEDNQNHTNMALSQLKTGLEAVQAGQDDIRRDMATKDDIHWLATKIDQQKRRIENLEEKTETPNPFKH